MTSPTLSQVLRGLGAEPRRRQGRRRRADDAELPAIPGDLAGDRPRRRGRRAGQHQPCRRLAAALDRDRRAQAYHRRRDACSMPSPRSSRAWLRTCGSGRMAATDMACRASRARSRNPVSSMMRAYLAADSRRSRAVHLHLGHHRPAQGGRRQPSSADAMEPSGSPG